MFAPTPLPHWQELPEKMRRAWIAAAEQAAHRLIPTRFDDEAVKEKETP